MKKQDVHVFKGIQQDIDYIKHNPEFLVDARNIRVNNVNGKNLAVTTEQGTTKISLKSKIYGKYLGHCVINDYIVLFTVDSKSHIYRIDMSTKEVYELYQGNLNFDINYPIETLASYENEFVQKVYWTDGKNQPRAINIVQDKLDAERGYTKEWNDDSFNFVNKLALNEDIQVIKEQSSNGMFHSGTVQYAITYYNKYGQETNIAWISPLYYISFNNRAGSPEESIGNSFKFIISNVDTNFDYIRLYSIHRSSYNATPTVKIVKDMPCREYSVSEVTTKGNPAEFVLYDDTYDSSEKDSSDEGVSEEGEHASSDTPNTPEEEVKIASTRRIRADIYATFNFADPKSLTPSYNLKSWESSNCFDTKFKAKDIELSWHTTERFNNKHLVTITNVIEQDGSSTGRLDAQDLKNNGLLIWKIASPEGYKIKKISLYGLQGDTMVVLDSQGTRYADNDVNYNKEDNWFNVESLDTNIIYLATSGAAAKLHGITVLYNGYEDVTIDTNGVSSADYVDLGLSVKWSKSNLNGLFKWGELPKDKRKYNPDEPLDANNYVNNYDCISGTEYDPATKILGKGWRLPTYSEFLELLNLRKQSYTNDLVLIGNNERLSLPKVDGKVSYKNDSGSVLGYNGYRIGNYIPPYPTSSYVVQVGDEGLKNGGNTVNKKYHECPVRAVYDPNYKVHPKFIADFYPDIAVTKTKGTWEEIKKAKINFLTEGVYFKPNAKVYLCKMYDTDHTPYAIGTIVKEGPHTISINWKELSWHKGINVDEWVIVPEFGAFGDYTYRDYLNNKRTNEIHTNANAIVGDVSYGKGGNTVLFTISISITKEENNNDDITVITNKSDNAKQGHFDFGAFEEDDSPEFDYSPTVTNVKKASSSFEGTEYVDLGIGVKWATCNYNADYWYEYGEPFGFPDVHNTEKYQLSLEEDYVYELSGGVLRTPTEDEWEALFKLRNEVIYSEVTYNTAIQTSLKKPVIFQRFYGTNGNTLDIPIFKTSGEVYKISTDYDSIGLYRTSNSEDENTANVVPLGFDFFSISEENRKFYYPTRPVLVEKKVSGDSESPNTPSSEGSSSSGSKDSVITYEAIVITDNNIGGETIDPTSLLYVGGEEISAETICQKDGTLFSGNVSIIRHDVDRSMLPEKILITTDTRTVTFLEQGTGLTKDYNNLSLYSAYESTRYENKINTLDNPKTFKHGETYRLGIQFQYQTGKWSDPIYLEDIEMDKYPTESEYPIFTAKANFKEIYKLGYRKVRPVVVLPTIQNRKIIAQGVLNPSVYNVLQRQNGHPYAQSSWFYRPFRTKSSDYENKFNSAGHGVQYRHGYTLYGAGCRGAEIQGVPVGFSDKSVKNFNSKYKSYIDDSGNFYHFGSSSIPDSERYRPITIHDLGNIFAVDQQIVTFNSPDVEFDESLKLLDLNNLKVKIVGKVTFENSFGDIDIQVSTSAIATDAAGFTRVATNNIGNGGVGLVAGLFFEDYVVDDDGSSKNFKAFDREDYPVKYMVYPWHKKGSLNNDAARTNDEGTRTAVLKKKIISNIKVTSTKWFNSTYDIIQNGISLFDSDQMAMSKIDGHSYYGNVDTLLFPPNENSVIFSLFSNYTPPFESTELLFMGKSRENYYDITAPSGNTKPGARFSTVLREIGDKKPGLRVSREGIRMKYKSSPHMVISLSNNLEALSVGEDIDNSLYIAEIYRDTTVYETGEFALKNDLWIPAGTAISINDKDVKVDWLWGDTYYQRYECLKTYPFTGEDENQIVEIGSFMLESRVNCCGRYDKNKGQTSNLYMSKTNFNLFNSVYNQEDNFFNYRVYDDDFYILNSFKTAVMWSKEKHNADEIDPWTNITMASMIDLDGDKGELKALKTFNSSIYAFQEKGISNILFNERAQIPTSEGVPIEISNNYKVEGKRYVAEHLGISNKKSIVSTPSGLYFIDAQSKDLYSIGSQFTNVSASNNMSSYFDSLDNNIELFYDFNESDLYIKTSNDVLCFSEKLGQFVSFFDYKEALTMFNVRDVFYAFNDNKGLSLYSIGTEKFGYKLSIFNKTYNSSISFISNADGQYNKLFTNIDIRGDWYNNGNIVHDSTASTIRVSNEYQDTGVKPLTNSKYTPSNAKKKFRVWRYDIPRNKGTMQRISNMWCRVDINSTLPMVIHDLDVTYYT